MTGGIAQMLATACVVALFGRRNFAVGVTLCKTEVILTALIVPFTAFTALFFLPVLFVVVNAVYRWVTISSGSATLGMRMTAIEFRRADGQVFDAGTAFVHTLGYLISASMVLPQVLSVALMMLSPRGQGLTDMVLGSVAINRSARY